MNREELQELIQKDGKEILDKISKFEKKVSIDSKKYTIEEIRKQYEPASHNVMKETERPDKLVQVPTGETYPDALTGEVKEQYETRTVPVARLPIPLQKKIVLIAAAFLVGDKIKLESLAETPAEKLLLSFVMKVWQDNKLDYKSKQLAKLMMSETHCAELWYDFTDNDYWQGTENSKSTRRPGVMILAESKGDKLYAVKDEFGDLIAFARGYKVTRNEKEYERLDVYTETKIVFIEQTENNSYTKTERDNPYNAIPVIYYEQDAPEWADVQKLIERKETKLSNLADTNDYFDSPAVVAEGDVDNLPSKGEIGKVFQIERGGKLQYLTYDNASASSELEFKILDTEIHAGTHTPDISFDTMKGILSNLSGVAIRLLFLDPQLKAIDKQEQFGEFIQRRLNLLKKILISFNPALLESAAGLSISPKFKEFMPVNEIEYNQMLMSAFEKGMISRKTMLELSTLVKDAQAEAEQIDSEKALEPKEGGDEK